ncbi:MAG: peptide MFS transporter [Candidatus Riflebacteria bacterium]|nr:peptide MFS transporter [Candidatus Riflebacteria bacterium]
MQQDVVQQEGHPRGLYLLFVVEMAERFSYYGMRAIFVLFLIKALLISKEAASNIYGSFTGLVYLTPLIGGYISDRYWGNRRSIVIGGLLMALGQFFMFCSGSSLYSPSAQPLMLAALTTLIIGNGFFKPNISTLIGQLYPKGDKRVDGAFTIFYMGINLGAFFSPLICGSLGEKYDAAGASLPAEFRWGFLAACIGMLISVAIFLLLKDKHIVDPDGNPVGLVPVPKENKPELTASSEIAAGVTSPQQIMAFAVLGVVLVAAFKHFLELDWIGSFIFGSSIAIPLMIICDRSLNREEREKIFVIFILAFFVIFFWSAFEQAGASLTLFAEQQIDRGMSIKIPGILIVLVLSAICVYLARFFSWFFLLGKTSESALSIMPVILFISLYFLGYIQTFVQNEVPASWFQSINPLGIVVMAPLFSILWGWLGKRNMEPPSPLKMAAGLALLCLGYIVIAFGVKGVDASVKISMWWLVILYLLHTTGELCLSPIGLSMVSKLAPARFASLLMGTWFLSNAAANKLAGTLSALIPPGAGEVKAEAAAKIPVFLGYAIPDLYTFFMIFIVMSGVAAILLLILYRFLERMMHGVK